MCFFAVRAKRFYGVVQIINYIGMVLGIYVCKSICIQGHLMNFNFNIDNS
jgi:NADH:ubiquinone oxidoreductase subunit 6 (subunit J)